MRLFVPQHHNQVHSRTRIPDGGEMKIAIRLLILVAGMAAGALVARKVLGSDVDHLPVEGAEGGVPLAPVPSVQEAP